MVTKSLFSEVVGLELGEDDSIIVDGENFTLEIKTDEGTEYKSVSILKFAEAYTNWLNSTITNGTQLMVFMDIISEEKFRNVMNGVEVV